MMLSLIISSNADKISSDSLFFTEIEKELRRNYLVCNKDSSQIPMKQILQWKKDIDSITQSPEYPYVIKEFYTSNKNTHNALPCEIVLWYRTQLLSKHRFDSSLLAQKKAENERVSDSVFISAELRKVKKMTYDYKDIPFGISKKTFLFLAKKAGLSPLFDEEKFIYYKDSGDSAFKSVAFNFDNKGIYFSYEIESVSLPVDSIDSHIRLYLDKLTMYFQKKVNQSPQQSNYIGNFEINQDQLSISRMWSVQNAKIYTGIAAFKNRYYAKAIIKCYDL